MSYTLNVEPDVVREAESYAVRNGTTLDAMIRAYLLMIGVQSSLRGMASLVSDTADEVTQVSRIKIGSMRNEVKLPNEFDHEFDQLDAQVATMFDGTPA